ncbi:MAG: hypothetical protein ACP5EQ_07705, partial [Candidatus Cloacimonadia bacterium]
IWRNHLLGLSMMLNGDIQKFYSLTLYPQGNEHFVKAIPVYKSFLQENKKKYVEGITYEQFIGAINGDDKLIKWRDYLSRRYIVS